MTFDLEHVTLTKTIVFVHFQLLLKPAFQKLFSNSLPYNVVQHVIFKHPLPLTLVLWAWPCKVWPCQFWVFINVNIMRMDRVTHYHINLCLTFDLVLWPWHWKTCPFQLSVINASIFNMGIATFCHIMLCNKVTWNILIHLNIYILHDA